MTSSTYRSLTWLLIAAATATLVGRLGQVQSASGRTPFMSANDRSRWSTVRALVDHGTYVLDDVIFLEPPSEDEGGLKPPRVKRDGDWYSIDLVRHRGADGREHYYSSKPPLLATLVAGQYWILKQCTGVSIAEQPFYVGRILLLFTNILPMAGAWILLSRLLDGWHPELAGAVESDSPAQDPFVARHQSGLWARLFIMASATWGTLLSPMAVTLNNHTPAAIAALVAVAALLRLWRADGDRGQWYLLAGFAAAFTATNELPALSLFALAAIVAAVRNLKRAVCFFVPGAAVVAAAALLTTYLAHGTVIPPYAHRSDGRLVATVSDPSAVGPARGSVGPTAAVRDSMAKAGVELSERATLRPAGESRWTLWDPATQRRWAIVATESHAECREWDNWYDYEGTYWKPDRLRGVDRGEVSRVRYAFHAILGHHGILSLSPIWLLSMLGAGFLWRRGSRVARGLAGGVVVLTAICLVFYISRPLIDRNYGGVSCGLRWMFWFIPLWLVLAYPAVDRLATSRWGRLACLISLAVSVFSAAWSATRPWTHPWIFEYWTQLGWLNY